MTSLHHHSASAGGGSGGHLHHNGGGSVNSSSALSPVIQRKIDSQQTPTNSLQQPHQHQQTHSRYAGAGVDFDTTSIASVSESSHWSGGGGDDLDNIALVNGSDTNTMENKEWCSYLKLGKNGYNSSDDDDDDDGNDSNGGRANGSKNDDSSVCEEGGVGGGGHSKPKHSRHRKSKRINSTNSSSSNIHVNSKSSAATAPKNPSTGTNRSSRGAANVSSSSSSLASASKAVGKSNGHHRHGQAVEESSKLNGKPPTAKVPLDADAQLFKADLDERRPNRSSRTGLKHHADSKFQKRGEGSSGTGGGHQDSHSVNSNETADDKARKNAADEDNYNESYENVDDEDDEENDDDDDDDDDNDDDDDDDDSDEEEEEDDLDDDDIWTIKPKLHSYYEKQFKTMQPNLNGFITGAVAKPFFERSRLPLNELSKIWELSDVTKDGALSFSEFCTAMHLVVLRVRNFELPNELPPKLQPYAPLIDFNSEAAAATAAMPTSTRHEDSMTNLSDSEDITVCSPTHHHHHHMTKSQSGQASSSDKPVVFGVGKPSDSGFVVAHPVALRIHNNQQQQQQQPATGGLIPEPPPRHSRSSSLGAIIHNALPPNGTAAANPPQTPAAGATTTGVTGTPATPGGQQQMSAFSSMPTAVPGSAPVVGTASSKLQQQPPAVPPRITSPPPAHLVAQQQQYLLQSQDEQQQHNGQAHISTSAGPLLPPPPPPPLPHNHQHLHRLQQHQLQQQQQLQQQHQHHTHLVHQHSVPAPGPGSLITATRAPPPPPINPSQYSAVPPLLPAMPSSMNAHLAASSLEDSHRLLERLVEQMQQLNLERLKKTSESTRTLANGANEIEALVHSIRTQSEQNQLLKRSYAELEKEFRNLTDSRIALEIKLDILNTSSLATATPTIVSQPSVITTSVSAATAATSTGGLQSPISQANSTPVASAGGPQALAASNLATVVKSKTANMNLIHSTPISTLQTPLSAASGVMLANQLAGSSNNATGSGGNHGNAPLNGGNMIAASAANQTNATSSKLII